MRQPAHLDLFHLPAEVARQDSSSDCRVNSRLSANTRSRNTAQSLFVNGSLDTTDIKPTEMSAESEKRPPYLVVVVVVVVVVVDVVRGVQGRSTMNLSKDAKSHHTIPGALFT